MLFRSAVAFHSFAPMHGARGPFDIKALPHFQKSISYSCILTVFNTIRFYHKPQKIPHQNVQIGEYIESVAPIWWQIPFGQLNNFQLIWSIDWTCGDKFSLFFCRTVGCLMHLGRCRRCSRRYRWSRTNRACSTCRRTRRASSGC